MSELTTALTNRNSSYQNAKENLGQLQESIMDLLSTGPSTRRQLAQALDRESNCVTAAVLALITLGHVYENGSIRDPETGKKQTLIHAGRRPADISVKVTTKQKLELAEFRALMLARVVKTLTAHFGQEAEVILWNTVAAYKDERGRQQQS
jgi:hypothetical protein